MRVVVINDRTNLQSVARLLGDQAGSKIALERLQALNPHVDFAKIEPGTVVFVPDAPGAAAPSVQGGAFAALHEQFLASVDAVGLRVRGGYEALGAERQSVSAALKLAAARRAIENDPDLKAQLDAAAEVFKQDQAQAKAANDTLRVVHQQAASELGALAKLLG